jgi:glycosyltransferase involved in cell wall biosynthesis
MVGWFDHGEDAVSDKLRRRIEYHPQIHCTGFVRDPAPYYRTMDLMVLPTWREGFPNAVLEAAASGIPVITTESTGSRDSVVPEVTGLLVPPGNPEAIADSVLMLLSDPVRRCRMGRAAHAWAAEFYGRKHVLGLTTSFYRELLQSEIPVAGAMVRDWSESQPAAM